jgi:hypothetical protein
MLLLQQYIRIACSIQIEVMLNMMKPGVPPMFHAAAKQLCTFCMQEVIPYHQETSISHRPCVEASMKGIERVDLCKLHSLSLLKLIQTSNLQNVSILLCAHKHELIATSAKASGQAQNVLFISYS